MPPFTAEQKLELREAIDRSKREALTESRRLTTQRAAKSAVVRAAEKAARAQQAVPIMRELVPPSTSPTEHCTFCGAPTTGGVCADHDDLAEVAS